MSIFKFLVKCAGAWSAGNSGLVLSRRMLIWIPHSEAQTSNLFLLVNDFLSKY